MRIDNSSDKEKKKKKKESQKKSNLESMIFSIMEKSLNLEHRQQLHHLQSSFQNLYENGFPKENLAF